MKPCSSPDAHSLDSPAADDLENIKNYLQQDYPHFGRVARSKIREGAPETALSLSKGLAVFETWVRIKPYFGDGLISESRRKEKGIPLEKVKAALIKGGRLRE